MLQAFEIIPVYVLVVFRIGAMMIFAPVLGSRCIPRRIKAMMACVLALGLAQGVSLPQNIPQTPWGLAVGLGGEIIFGLAMGMMLNFVFTAAQWAGELIGQQMGFGLGESFDPQSGSQGSIIGDTYLLLATVIFLGINGHHAMIQAVSDSFRTLPLMSATFNRSMLDLLLGLLQSATGLAVRMTAPILVTMLLADLSLGFIGKTVPQLNILTAGITVRSLVGLIVLIVGVGLTSDVIRQSMFSMMKTVLQQYRVSTYG